MNKPSNVHPGVRRSRRLVTAAARLHSGAEQWSAEVLDLSMSGVRLRRPAGLEASIGQPFEFELASASGTGVRLEARIARVSRDELALGFQHLGEDHERRLAEQIERHGRLLDGLDRD